MPAARAHTKGLERSRGGAGRPRPRAGRPPAPAPGAPESRLVTPSSSRARREVHVGLTRAPASPPDAGGTVPLRFAVRDTGIGIPRSSWGGLRGVHPGGRLHHPALRGHRPGPGHRRAPGVADGRARRGAECSRPGAPPSPSSCPPRAAGAGGACRTGRPGRVVLVADDSATNRLVLRRVLEGVGGGDRDRGGWRDRASTLCARRGGPGRRTICFCSTSGCRTWTVPGCWPSCGRRRRPARRADGIRAVLMLSLTR